jgi:hypothetical protein
VGAGVDVGVEAQRERGGPRPRRGAREPGEVAELVGRLDVEEADAGRERPLEASRKRRRGRALGATPAFGQRSIAAGDDVEAGALVAQGRNGAGFGSPSPSNCTSAPTRRAARTRAKRSRIVRAL